MAENLNYDVGGSTCYENDPANCEKFGRLYYKSTAMSACPAGFHLPSNTEWNILEKAVGGSKPMGQKLRSTSGWYNLMNGLSDNSGTDEYGFSALPGGFAANDLCMFRGGAGFWWSTVGNRGIWSNNRVSRNSLSGKAYKNSVRCVQD
jgi:uncharacterized protein (TIGR02145 family)